MQDIKKGGKKGKKKVFLSLLSLSSYQPNRFGLFCAFFSECFCSLTSHLSKIPSAEQTPTVFS